MSIWVYEYLRNLANWLTDGYHYQICQLKLAKSPSSPAWESPLIDVCECVCTLVWAQNPMAMITIIIPVDTHIVSQTDISIQIFIKFAWLKFMLIALKPLCICMLLLPNKAHTHTHIYFSWFGFVDQAYFMYSYMWLSVHMQERSSVTILLLFRDLYLLDLSYFC